MDRVVRRVAAHLDDLREALLKRDLARFTRTLDGLRQEGEALPLVLWAVSEEVRALTQIKLGLVAGRPLAGLFKEARVWGPRQNVIGKAVERLDETSLSAAMRALALIDRMVKGVAPGNPWNELLRLALLLCATPQRG